MFTKPSIRQVRAARRDGDAARDRKDWGAAAAAYRRVVQSLSGSFADHVQLGHMLKEAGDTAGARAAYSEARRLNPDDGDLLRWFGNLEAREGNDATALEMLTRSVELGHAETRQDLLDLQARLRQADDAGQRPHDDDPRRMDMASHASGPLASEAQFAIVKPLSLPSGTELALLVTHSRTGAIKPHVLPYVQALGKSGVRVLLIVVADRPADIAPDLLHEVAGAFVRENRGYDFACWAHALNLYPGAYAAPVLYLANDSVFGPATQARLDAVIERVRASGADIVGLTESHDHRWHIQSYFLALKPGALNTMECPKFFGTLQSLPDKDAVIQKYETQLAAALEGGGCRVEVLFPSHMVRNPTLFGWRGLLDVGFPFVKLLMLRGEFPAVDTDGWRETLASHGFDLVLLDQVLAAGTEGWTPHPGPYPLLARPSRAERPTRPEARTQPLKVAFFGPWNYDNGLGAASRGLIAAIRRCGVGLNLHPVKVPFHIHKALVPPVDVIDFSGTADIAVVHLNPDSWHLLTDAQRAQIGAARRRIGHWVWEMSHIPHAWRHNFSSVDRIWAPSGYCAGVFADEGEAPVDVIPYTVPLTEERPMVNRAVLLAGLGLPTGRRIILYAFDGASYLVRKNPAALVRAFEASGLERRGWSLVLKTKHLFDRADEGRGLQALARQSKGVLLLNASMSHAEMTDLAALCDIYASPHCSEGFGLTIAEAMAAGKPVVVTDFGGSREFVDATCGYPVRAHPWRLQEDFGHYTKGGEWARIDEPALAEALQAAAAAVERGDRTIPDAARRRVAETLSYDAVARRIAASFGAVMEETCDHPTRPIFSSLERGVPVAGAGWNDRLVLAMLGDDLAPLDKQPALATDRDTWIVFAPGNAFVSPQFRQVVTRHCTSRPDVSIFYADDVALGEGRFRDQVRLKPAFDPDLLAATDYVGVPMIVRASALHELGGLDRTAGAAALTDLLFRADELGMSIARIPEPLLAWKGTRPQAPRAVRRAAMARLPGFSSHELRDGLLPGTLQLHRRVPAGTEPAVTVIVPTRRTAVPGEAGTYVERLLGGLAKADWPADRLRVLVGDDVPGQPEWEDHAWPFALTRVETPRPPGEPFNYAAKMNRLWRMAETEHVVLMNDDVLPLDPAWLAALLTFSMDQNVGGAGARLIFDDGTLQHAGIAPLMGAAVHPWLGSPASRKLYGDWPLVHRDWSMVTGAVFATRRSVLDQVGGFDERFTLEFNDVDLCLRLRALGYRIAYTPHAELRHTEKASRGDTSPPGRDAALFLQRWRGWLAQDPSWHPLLRTDRLDAEPVDDPEAWYR